MSIYAKAPGRVRKVVACEVTCPVCPVEWSGRLEDGTYFCFRSEWGGTSTGLGATADAAGQAAYNEHGPDWGCEGHDMSDAEMMAASAEAFGFDWSDCLPESWPGGPSWFGGRDLSKEEWVGLDGKPIPREPA